MKAQNLIQSPERSSLSSVSYEITKEDLENIMTTRLIFKENPRIKYAAIPFTGDLRQFDSDMDDEDKNELIHVDDMDYFAMGIEEIIVSQYGSLCFKGYNKYDGSQFIEFEIEL
jgi:hypothetical protein